jgi:hypothetical protein
MAHPEWIYNTAVAIVFYGINSFLVKLAAEKYVTTSAT